MNALQKIQGVQGSRRSLQGRREQVLLPGSTFKVLMRESLLTLDLPQVGADMYCLLEAVGGTHSPEAEQLTWDRKVAEGSAIGRIPCHATRILTSRV